MLDGNIPFRQAEDALTRTPLAPVWYWVASRTLRITQRLFMALNCDGCMRSVGRDSLSHLILSKPITCISSIVTLAFGAIFNLCHLYLVIVGR